MSVGTGMSRSMGGALLGKVVLVGGGMATFALLARYLGAEGLGHYRTVLSILGLSAAVFDFGLYQVTLAEMSRDPGSRLLVPGLKPIIVLVQLPTELICW